MTSNQKLNLTKNDLKEDMVNVYVDRARKILNGDVTYSNNLSGTVVKITKDSIITKKALSS